MLAQIELNPAREQVLVHLEQETGENHQDLLLKMFDFYMENHNQKTLRAVPELSAERAKLFQKIGQVTEFNDKNSVCERYGNVNFG